MSSEPTERRDAEAFADPLVKLRSSDPRPRSVQWREQVSVRFHPFLPLRAPVVGLIVAGAVVATVVGWRLVVDSQPPVEASIPFAQPAAPPAPAATDPPSVVIVHVAGAVAEPGLIEADAGWRVADAVAAAGGSSAAADLDRVNLAAPLRDGERIYIPQRGEPVPAVAGAGSAASASAPAVGPVDLNTADRSALESLPGIGPATADAIMAHRDDHGLFGTVDALVAVRGIGPATLEAIRDHVVVG